MHPLAFLSAPTGMPTQTKKPLTPRPGKKICLFFGIALDNERG